MTLGTYIVKMLKIGFMGFGGGSALIPIIETEIINQQDVQAKEEYDKAVVVASITPGALPVELVASLGKFYFGIPGMILGPICLTLPGAILMLLMLTILTTENESVVQFVKIATVGISVYIIWHILDYCGSIVNACKKESNDRFYKCIGLISIVAIVAGEGNIRKLFELEGTPLFGVSVACVLFAAFFVAFFARGTYTYKNVAIIIIVCGFYFFSHGKNDVLQDSVMGYIADFCMIVCSLYGVSQSLHSKRNHIQINIEAFAKDIGIWVFITFGVVLILWRAGATPFLLRAMASVFMSFGGGDAYLSVADGLFVESGIISEELFYGEIVGIVNLLPGSILCKTLLGIGYDVGLQHGTTWTGIAFSLAGLFCGISMSGIAFFGVEHFYHSLSESKAFRIVRRWIRPIISGLLVNVMISLMLHCKSTCQLFGVSLPLLYVYVISMVLLNHYVSRKTKHSVFVIFIDIAFSFLWLAS